MADEKTKPKIEPKKEEAKAEVKADEIKTETKAAEVKKEEKVSTKLVKKTEAIVKGNNLHASMKQCMYICSFIKGKSIDEAIKMLEDVIKMKRAVPFKGEIPHRSEPGIMSGRYPINASKLFIPILKNLKGNLLVNQMELDNAKIYFASSNYASRPSKRGGGRFKRTNVILKAKEVPAKVVNKAS
jgi:large subunit ribosomal protein L22